MKHPIELGNYVMVLVGIVLTLSGPYILYRTGVGVRKAWKEGRKKDLQPFSNAINVLIGVAFFGAGILFVVNNLRGNPLY